MTANDIVKTRVLLFLTSRKENFVFESTKGEISFICDDLRLIVSNNNDQITIRYSNEFTSRKFKTSFEEKFNNIEDALLYFEYVIECQNDNFLRNELQITEFIKKNLITSKIGIDRVYNTNFGGIRNIIVYFEMPEIIKISLDLDGIKIRNYGKPGETNYGFYEIDPIFTSSNLEEVLVFLNENFGNNS